MKEKMTTVLLPRGRKQEENFVIVSVNGRSWKIMRGVEVRVPVCVAEVLENAAMMAEAARRYVDERASRCCPMGMRARRSCGGWPRRRALCGGSCAGRRGNCRR